MAETNINNPANVSSAKGVKGGYIFSAPIGTAATAPAPLIRNVSAEPKRQFTLSIIPS